MNKQMEKLTENIEKILEFSLDVTRKNPLKQRKYLEKVYQLGMSIHQKLEMLQLTNLNDSSTLNFLVKTTTERICSQDCKNISKKRLCKTLENIDKELQELGTTYLISELQERFADFQLLMQYYDCEFDRIIKTILSGELIARSNADPMFPREAEYIKFEKWLNLLPLFKLAFSSYNFDFDAFLTILEKNLNAKETVEEETETSFSNDFEIPKSLEKQAQDFVKEMFSE